MKPELDRATIPVTATDEEILRRFEPVVCFTRGERFLPANAADYVRECSLWVHRADGEDELLVRQGELSAERLLELPPAGFGDIHYLRFVEPLGVADAARVLAERNRLRPAGSEPFRAGVGRLARGGLLPRMADAAFSLSLLLRGRVPAATAAAAELAYRAMEARPRGQPAGDLTGKPGYTYYGHVHRAGGWTVLQYWFFYCYNNWRSGFQGVNDHEADWENLSIYLYELDGNLYPEWAAAASHESSGDDMRRRWDDNADLKVVDGHPLVFVAAGSHAAYFRRGEYQAEVNVRIPGWLRSLVRNWRRFWTEVLGQRIGDPFRIPFVDYARGDGIKIGPEREYVWKPILIDDATPWLSRFRGLWGLFAQDPISGENAPAGPMYDRDGTPRLAWFDPLGYVGLDRVAPPPAAARLLEEEFDRVAKREHELAVEIEGRSSELQALGVRHRAMEGRPHLATQFRAVAEELAERSRALRRLRSEFSDAAILREAMMDRLAGIRAGRREDGRSHIMHPMFPVSPAKARYERLIEAWAPVSLSALLVGAALLLLMLPGYFWGGFLVLVLLFVVLEAGLRGAIAQTVSRMVTTLGLIAVCLLLAHFWRQTLALSLLAAAIHLLAQRLRERAK